MALCHTNVSNSLHHDQHASSRAHEKPAPRHTAQRVWSSSVDRLTSISLQITCCCT